MRYVILFAGLAFFLIWDALYNDAQYFAWGARSVLSYMRWLGLW